ncbi:hypothetical protein [Williamsia sterculiae]|uniref:Uncharacterized protein n=1 Tax=Williamsia sterculiae TaxID=1344003 RepID=A0A1N7F297_9NOCA|nr:hypothetical protein [Williamsia sterculiae]SIR94457.1 hypothetical protein SAMN05445060_1738 [Williamsia sterculiae]
MPIDDDEPTGPNLALLRGFSTALTLLGSVILIGCVGYLMVGWWDDKRWTWLILGVVVIAVNLALLFTRLRPTPKPRDWTVDEVREVIAPIHGEVAQIRTLRRRDRGLGLAQAVELVRAANGTEE